MMWQACVYAASLANVPTCVQSVGKPLLFLRGEILIFERLGNWVGPVTNHGAYLSTIHFVAISTVP